MNAYGFNSEMLAEMIRDGLAAVSAERLVAGGKSIEIARVKITEAGRWVLAQAKDSPRRVAIAGYQVERSRGSQPAARPLAAPGAASASADGSAATGEAARGPAGW